MSDKRISSRERLSAWWEQKRPCKEVYGGDCNIYIGPPRWSHRINRYDSDPPFHPTPEQALRAARNLNTLSAVLVRLANWDPEEHRDVCEAARSNPNYVEDA